MITLLCVRTLAHSHIRAHTTAPGADHAGVKSDDVIVDAIVVTRSSDLERPKSEILQLFLPEKKYFISAMKN